MNVGEDTRFVADSHHARTLVLPDCTFYVALVHAGNPGPMTGDGNWTWLIPGRTPTLVDAGVGNIAHLEALDRALALSEAPQTEVVYLGQDSALTRVSASTDSGFCRYRSYSSST